MQHIYYFRGYSGVMFVMFHSRPHKLHERSSQGARRFTKQQPKLGVSVLKALHPFMDANGEALLTALGGRKVLAALGVAAWSTTAALSGLGTPVAAALSVDDVHIVDPTDLLSEAEEQQLKARTAEAGLDPAIHTTTFLVWRSNAEELNDAVVNYAKQHQPELLSQDQLTFGQGQLILAVATEDRLTGIYGGEDVDQAIGLRKNLDSYLDAMGPAFRDAQWAEGFGDGIEAIARGAAPGETDDAGSDSEVPWIILMAGGGGVLALGSAAVHSSRKKSAQQLKEQYNEISQHYGQYAQRLQQIDIRAHNLRSPLVNAQLRNEWETIRDGFLRTHEQMSTLDGLSLDSPDGEFRKHRQEIEELHSHLSELRNAEANIDTLFAMENGDPQVRAAELNHLLDDIAEAHAVAKDAQQQRLFGELSQRGRSLLANLHSPTMVDEYARLIADYQIAVKALADKQFAKADVVQAPGLGSSEFHAGYGYQNFIPLYLIASSHDSAVAAASSSSTNTSFSGGFSGAGGSGRF